MTTIKLLRNDDETLDPSDPTMVQRGSLMIDGNHAGTWEKHRSGEWTAFVNRAGFKRGSTSGGFTGGPAKLAERVAEHSEQALIARIAALLGAG